MTKKTHSRKFGRKDPHQHHVRTLKIDRRSQVTEDIFKRICKEKRKTPVHFAKLTRQNLKAFISKKYKSTVAKIVCDYFDFREPYDFE